MLFWCPPSSTTTGHWGAAIVDQQSKTSEFYGVLIFFVYILYIVKFLIRFGKMFKGFAVQNKTDGP